jgi:hypothetical protein
MIFVFIFFQLTPVEQTMIDTLTRAYFILFSYIYIYICLSLVDVCGIWSVVYDVFIDDYICRSKCDEFVL